MTSTQSEILEVFPEFDFSARNRPKIEPEQVVLRNVEELNLFDLGQERELTRREENSLQLILHEYFNPGAMQEEEVVDDFQSLRTINCEIKNINAQSIILHGQRIRRAQEILKKYREGAFTAWLQETYGNRQTPYSILQYCDLYHELPTENLKKKLEAIPRKAAYTLAGRTGDLSLKKKILENHADEGQKELIMLIQDTFPLPQGDRRKRKEANLSTIDSLMRLSKTLSNRKMSLTPTHRTRIRELVDVLEDLLEEPEQVLAEPVFDLANS